MRASFMPLRGHLMRGPLVLGALCLALGCGPIATSGPGCREAGAPVPLPDALRESSGVAVSLEHPDVFWSHNDAEPALFAVGRDGGLLARYPLGRAVWDVEDIALSQCTDGGSCLYLADLGDNYEERPGGQILRMREPDPSLVGGKGHGDGVADTIRPDAFPVRLPDGPRDIEALLVFPGERVFAVTKGRNDPVTVYRYPGALRPDTVVLEEVQRLSDGPRILPRQVTGGAVSPLGGLVALRTYEAVRIYTAAGDTLVPLPDGLLNLHTLREPQGEGVGIGLDGTVALTSEGGPVGGSGSIAFVRCRLDGA